MPDRLYDTREWKRLRAEAIARDAGSCTVARLLGGGCHPRLEVHHLIPISEGGAPLELSNVATVCSAHHPMLEALRRQLLARRLRAVPSCPHRHPYPEGRRVCEARLRRLAA